MKTSRWCATVFLSVCVPVVAAGQTPIKAVAAMPHLAPKVTSAVAKSMVTTQTERFILPAFDVKNTANLAVTLGNSPHKKLLNSHTSYTQYDTRALQSLREIHSFATAPRAGKGPAYLIRGLQSFVKDPYLMQVMEKNLSTQNYELALRDLAGFYGLTARFIPPSAGYFAEPPWEAMSPEDIFVFTTVDFLNRHPHKVPLHLREMLKTPQIGSQYKNIIQTYLHQPTPFSADCTPGLIATLREIYGKYTLSLNQAYQSPEIRITRSYYNQLLSDLEDFVAAHRRAPRWDGPAEEKTLYNQLAIITHGNPFNLFTEALSPLQQINDMLSQYPAVTRSWEETLQRIEEFVQQHGFYPRSYQASNGNTTEEELELLEHVKHYTNQNRLLYQDIDQLKAKYNL